MVQSATAIHFDSIVARVATGETLTDACSAFGIKRGTLKAYLHSHPELRARLDAARPLSGQALVRAKYDEILAAIRNGATAEGAVESFGGTGVSFFKVVKADPDAKARFIAATSEREAGDAAIGKRATARQQRHFRAEDFNAVLTALENASRKYQDIFDDQSLPSSGSVSKYARRNASFRERLADVIASRRKARADARPKPTPKIERPLGVLLRALKLNSIYAAAFAVVSRFDPADRDDAVSEIILAVLEDELAVAEIKTKGKRFAYRQVFADQRWLASLDAPVFENNDVKMTIDTIANPDPILFY